MSMPNYFEMVLTELSDMRRILDRIIAEKQNEHGLDKFKFLRVEPAAEMLGVSVPTLRLYTSKKKIACHKRGHYVYYKIDDLNDFIEKGRYEAKKGLA